MNTNRIRKLLIPAAAAALAAASLGAAAQSAAAKEDSLQLKADREALHRQLQRLEADEARLKADAASGRMSAESKDSYEVYLAREAVKGEKKDIAQDKAASLQMKADKEALRRQIRRLELAEKRLKADAAEGRMSATSPDAERVYKDRQAVKAEEKQVAADKARLKADQKK